MKSRVAALALALLASAALLLAPRPAVTAADVAPAQKFLAPSNG